MTLDGWKTYILGVLMICYALASSLMEKMTWAQSLEIIMIALGIMGLRHGVNTGA